MEIIKFSTNWNNKLSNKAFTTLRLHNPNKYKRGTKYSIECKGQLKGVAEMKDIRTLKISSLNDFITFLDTGYNVADTVKILQTMYKNVNWDTQLLDFCLLVFGKETDKDLFVP